VIRLTRGLTFALTIIGVAVCAAMIIVTGLGAFGRYLGLTGVTWTFEIVGMLFLWIIAIGAVLSEIAGENVSIDGNIHESGRGPWMRLYHAVVLLVVAYAFLTSGWALLARTAFNPTPLLRAPYWVIHSTIVFMGASLAVIAMMRIIRLLVKLRG
jgi:TRAP-type C4-dicarboxylate transport system permease small subunit